MQKDWLSFDEQLELLARRGMRIEDECTAVQVLSRVSYYRFSGYFRYWQKDPLPLTPIRRNIDRL